MILTNELAVEMETKVSFIVNKYASSYNREDLMQAGKMGVIKAANNFDPTLRIKFSTFCEKYILGEVLKYLRDNMGIKYYGIWRLAYAYMLTIILNFQ